MTYKKKIMQLGAAILVAGMVSACGNMSKNVYKDGSGADELVWKDISKVTPMHKHKDVYGTWPNKDNLEKISQGMSKEQIKALIGEPHYSEFITPREWNYVFNFRRAETGEHYICQYKVLFDKDKYAQSFYWNPEGCMNEPVPEEPTVETFTLGADALFAFDSDKIKPEGRDELDEFAQTLIEHDGSVENVAIKGYTDRIGSDAYNQALSEKRANAVRNYLTGQGVPAGIMTAEGLGNSSPVVHCESGARNDVIQCLQPNRRVEVEISGQF